LTFYLFILLSYFLKTELQTQKTKKTQKLKGYSECSDKNKPKSERFLFL